MKNLSPALFLTFLFLSLGSLCKAQDYNDLGRAKTEEFSILKFNGYKLTKIQSSDLNQEVYLAKKSNQGQFENIITIDKSSQTVVSVIWNFDSKNMDLIKGLLKDMNPTDTSSTRLENKSGIALMTINPEKEGYDMVIWKKKV